MNEVQIYLVRVTADDRSLRFWAVATSREQAVDRVLEIVPEGWSACLLDEFMKPEHEAISDMKPREARELRNYFGATFAVH